MAAKEQGEVDTVIGIASGEVWTVRAVEQAGGEENGAVCGIGDVDGFRVRDLQWFARFRRSAQSDRGAVGIVVGKRPIG